MKAVVLISADAEWRALRELFPLAAVDLSPFGEWFVAGLPCGAGALPVLFFQGGWGKIAAAASTQYALDRWAPDLLVNLGTCGGFEGEIAPGEIILAERTVVYDIVEQMGDPGEAIAHYATDLDLAWLGEASPLPVRRTVLVSADRDIVAEDMAGLQERFGAVAADWESGAIAWVAARHGVRCLILRSVTDTVGPAGGEAYGNIEVFRERTRTVMRRLVAALPLWIG